MIQSRRKTIQHSSTDSGASQVKTAQNAQGSRVRRTVLLTQSHVVRVIKSSHSLEACSLVTATIVFCCERLSAPSWSQICRITSFQLSETAYLTCLQLPFMSVSHLLYLQSEDVLCCGDNRLSHVKTSGRSLLCTECVSFASATFVRNLLQ
jgi:hypothetical protein